MYRVQDDIFGKIITPIPKKGCFCGVMNGHSIHSEQQQKPRSNTLYTVNFQMEKK